MMGGLTEDSINPRYYLISSLALFADNLLLSKNTTNICPYFFQFNSFPKYSRNKFQILETSAYITIVNCIPIYFITFRVITPYVVHDFSPFSKVFTNIHEYTNKMIAIHVHNKKIHYCFHFKEYGPYQPINKRNTTLHFPRFFASFYFFY